MKIQNAITLTGKYKPIVVEYQARNLELRGSNRDHGSNFSLEFKLELHCLNFHILVEYRNHHNKCEVELFVHIK